MKKLLLFVPVVLSLLFISCEDKYISNGRKAYKKYFKEVLKDPESLKIYEEKITRDGEYTVIFDVDYGAKNGFGAYGREKIHFETIGGDQDLIFVDGKAFSFDK